MKKNIEKNKKRYRKENKYICNDLYVARCVSKISKLLKPDKHADKRASYSVHSLYFDDYRNSCVFENDAGLSKRKKWRIRYYNHDISYLKLEKKEKINNLCLKKSCQISLKDYQNIINKNYFHIIWSTNLDLLKEFAIEAITRFLRPSIVVDYTRVAYIEPQSNVRVTFDKNISGSLQIDKFLTNDYTKIPVCKNNTQILEIKYDEILPSYIKHAVNSRELNQNTFSKYYTCKSYIERK